MRYERTAQLPIHSGYDASSTARDVLGSRRLDGLVAVVTGGYAGIGLETTRALAHGGARVIVAGRSPDKARAALAGTSGASVDSLDLAAPESVDAFAERFLATDSPLHLLINNAGVMATPFGRDARGFECQLATNHIGHFQLTLRLWPALLRARRARVVQLSSRGHARSGVDFDDPHFERRPYDKWLAYGQSKTANALFAVGLDARGAAHGVRAFSVHPGAVETELMRSMPVVERQRAIATALALSPLKSAEQGAATTIWCAVAEELEGKGGVYCEDADIAMAVPADHPEPRGVRPWASDGTLAERLWALSETWTGLHLNGPSASPG